MFEEVRAGKKSLQDDKRALKEKKRETTRKQNRELVKTGKPLELAIDTQYQTIVIDPPWDWGDEVAAVGLGGRS